MSDSRYKDTYVRVTSSTAELGLWNPPLEFRTPKADWKTHVVRQNEVGFLDILAVQYFGSGMETLWWVIAQANGMVDPDAEMYAGMKLRVPTREDVLAYIARESTNV